MSSIFQCVERLAIARIIGTPLNYFEGFTGTIVEGDIGVCGIAVLVNFSCGVAVILILNCVIAVFSESAG